MTALPINSTNHFGTKGSLVAIITPMLEDGRIDWPGYKKLIDWHIVQGTHGIVAVGTTGESPTVTPDEHIELIQVAVEQARGRVPIIAGTGANATAEAIHLTHAAAKAGANATLQVVPYYNKPTQEGMYQHFRAVALECGLPVILYNVPSRTVADLHNDTVLRLAEVPGVVGLKDATGDLVRAISLLRQAPKDFLLFSGNDDSALALIGVGGAGVISVTANLLPAKMAKMCELALSGDMRGARELNDQMFSLHTELFVETNPIGVKWAMAQMGLCGDAVRLPLVRLSAAGQTKIHNTLSSAGLLV
jgi:4-hydroxy-tetrahydrodipicolinate synthase